MDDELTRTLIFYLEDDSHIWSIKKIALGELQENVQVQAGFTDWTEEQQDMNLTS